MSEQNSAASPDRPPALRSYLWPKGVSGNPGGRPKAVALVADLARTHTPKAIETLAAIMNDDKAPRMSRIAAANALLDRAWGKPPQSVGVSVDVDEPSPENTSQLDLARRIAFTLQAGLHAQSEAQRIRDTATPAEIVPQDSTSERGA